MIAGLKPLPRLKGMKRLKKLKGLGGTRLKMPDLAIPEISDGPTAPVADKLVEFTRRLNGDEKLAKRCVKLQERYPQASLPECVTYLWLEQNQIEFIYQSTFFGGRAVRGGLLPDFLVDRGDEWYAWEIQGEYWHSDSRFSDLADHLRLRGSYFAGQRVGKVIELWESDIYDKRPTIFTSAMAGLGLRG